MRCALRGSTGRRMMRAYRASAGRHLTVANGIEHSNAHDAMADVYATIAMAAKLVKTQQPRLFDYLYAHRNKRKLATLISTCRKCKPLVACFRYVRARHAATPAWWHRWRGTRITVTRRLWSIRPGDIAPLLDPGCRCPARTAVHAEKPS